MSRTLHERKLPWKKRYPNGGIKVAMQSPGNAFVEYVGPLTQEQFDAIFAALFPKKTRQETRT